MSIDFQTLNQPRFSKFNRKSSFNILKFARIALHKFRFPLGVSNARLWQLEEVVLGECPGLLHKDLVELLEWLEEVNIGYVALIFAIEKQVDVRLLHLLVRVREVRLRKNIFQLARLVVIVGQFVFVCSLHELIFIVVVQVSGIGAVFTTIGGDIPVINLQLQGAQLFSLLLNL